MAGMDTNRAKCERSLAGPGGSKSERRPGIHGPDVGTILHTIPRQQQGSALPLERESARSDNAPQFYTATHTHNLLCDRDDHLRRHSAPFEGIGAQEHAAILVTSGENVGQVLSSSGSASLPCNSISGDTGIEPQDPDLFDKQNERAMSRSEPGCPHCEAGYDGVVHGPTSRPMPIQFSHPVDSSSQCPRMRDGETAVATHLQPEISCESSAPGRGGVRFCGPSHGGGVHGIRDVCELGDPRETRSRLEPNSAHRKCENNPDVHKLPDGEDYTLPEDGSGDHGLEFVPEPVISADIKSWCDLEVDSQLVATSDEGGFVFRVGGVLHQLDFTMTCIRVGEGEWQDCDDWRGRGGVEPSREDVRARDIMEVDLSTLTLDFV